MERKKDFGRCYEDSDIVAIMIDHGPANVSRQTIPLPLPINRVSCFSKNTFGRGLIREPRIRNFMRVCFTHGDTLMCAYMTPVFLSLPFALFVQKMD